MARSDNKPEMQHYVPRVLLKNFAGGKKDGQVHAFDKHVGKRIPNPTSIANLCGERNFNAADTGQGIVSIEQPLSELEGKAGPVIESILEQRSLAKLTAAERQTLAEFAIVQFLRVPRFQEVQRDIITAMLERAKKIKSDADLTELEAMLKKDAIKLRTIDQIVTSAATLATAVNQYKWLLFSTSDDKPFWISDCPVVMHNDKTFGPYGNIGFGVRGIQIYMPLSPTLMLGIWETSQADEMKEGYDKAVQRLKNLRFKRLMDPNVDRAAIDQVILEHEAKLQRPAPLVESLENGTPLKTDDQNVMFFNSLQYMWSYRFVLCASGTFELADRMAKEKPHLKKGLRITTS